MHTRNLMALADDMDSVPGSVWRLSAEAHDNARTTAAAPRMGCDYSDEYVTAWANTVSLLLCCEGEVDKTAKDWFAARGMRP